MNMLQGYRFIAVGAFLASTAAAQNIAPTAPGTPTKTTVCNILADPARFNNRLVKVQGRVVVTDEYALIEDNLCTEGIWFAFADGTAPPGLVAVVLGKGLPGSVRNGTKIPPIQVHLIRDRNYHKFIESLQKSEKGEHCTDLPPSDQIPNCTTYRVSATFIGRLDGVSSAVRSAHRQLSSKDRPDFKGFGHMGLFDAQLVVALIKDVVVVEDIVSDSSPGLIETRPVSGSAGAVAHGVAGGVCLNLERPLG